jgi:hypothetical protein
MTTLYVLVGVCIWVLGFYKLRAHGALMDFLEFFSPNCGYIILLLSLFAWCHRWVTQCYGWNLFNDFLIGIWKWILYVIDSYLILDLYFWYVIKTFIMTLKSFVWIYDSVFCLRHIYTFAFLYKILVYGGGV